MDEETRTQPNPTPGQPINGAQNGNKLTPDSSATSNQAQPAATQQPVYNQSTLSNSGTVPIGVSASQMGLNQPKKKLLDFNPRQLIVKGLIILIVIVGILAALAATNIIALGEFKTINYASSGGARFKLKFYARHSSSTLNSGNTRLLSKNSKDGKFPITLSISTTDEMSAYNRIKDCSGFTKAFDVQNNNLNQKISVCDFSKQANSQGESDAVYIAGFTHNNKAHIITIGQDYKDVDLSSPSAAQESLTKFGMQPYREDLEKIIASIKVE